jgi:signal transduction histidine kinase
LTNLDKHAGTTEARVALVRRGRKVHLEIGDEGCGFDTSAVPGEGGGSGERVGLASIREGVGLLRGELEIESRPSEGTSIVAEVPLPAPSENPASGHGRP